MVSHFGELAWVFPRDPRCRIPIIPPSIFGKESKEVR
jgi:hypothetical protein